MGEEGEKEEVGFFKKKKKKKEKARFSWPVSWAKGADGKVNPPRWALINREKQEWDLPDWALLSHSLALD